MIDVILYQPEIPGNTGNIIRLCANTGARLHLIEPLGFDMDDQKLRRAGLDYHEYASVRIHKTLAAVQLELADRRWFAFSTKAHTRYDQAPLGEPSALLFGPETRGLPAEVLTSLPEGQRLLLPQQANSRSLNLSNAVAVAVYEAWRQRGFVAI